MSSDGPYRARPRRPGGARLLAPAISGARRSAALLGASAATALTGAAAAGSTELALFAGLGALAAGLDWWRARRGDGAYASVVRFLGSDEIRRARGRGLDAASLYSLDGRRRVRPGPDGLRYEVLGADGRQTRLCFRVREASFAERRWPRRAAPARFARVQGRCLAPVCFDGPPPELGGSRRRHELAWLRLEPREGGALLERLDAFGRSVGDTWHPDAGAARAQIRRELGPHAGPLRRRRPAWERSADAPAWE